MNDPVAEACGCGDYEVSRRSLLKTAGLVGMAGVTSSMFGDVLTSTAYGASNGNVLVLLSLRGGADGLSMVVPHAEQAYYAARPGTAVKADSLLHKDATFGLHQSFGALSPLWTQGKMAAIQAVGLPTPNRSHFEAMELVEDADPGSSARIGWLNRMIEGLVASPTELNLVSTSNTVTPTSLIGPAPSLATTDFSQLTFPFSDDTRHSTSLRRLIEAQARARGGILRGPTAAALSLTDHASGIAAQVKEGAQNGASYANGDLAKALKNTAALIRGGVGVRAVAVDYGGWDNHTGLRWKVSSQIEHLSKNLQAFFTDLGPAASRVTVVTLSEFGRRLQENGSAGVDHGYGNCVFVLGGGVKGGQFYGKWPGLSQGKQVDGDLAVTTDFRAVLADVLRSRFPALDVSDVFPGFSRGSGLGFMA